MRVLCILSLLFAVSAVSNPENPVSKVTALIRNLIKQNEADTTASKEQYEKFSCWCINNSDQTAKDMHKNEEVAEEQRYEIQLQTTVMKVQNNKIDRTNEEIKDANEKIEKAQKTYDDETTHWNEVRTENEAIIGACKECVKILEDKPDKKEAFVQMSQKGKDMLEYAQSLIGMKEGFLQGGSSRAYAGQVIGQLNGIVSSAEEDNATHKDEFETAEELYNTTMKAENANIKAANEEQEQAQSDLADAADAKATAETTWADNDAAYKRNIEFFDSVNKDCRAVQADFVTNMDTREAELTALKAGLKILDDNRDLFIKATSVNFIQISPKVMLLDKLSADTKAQIGTVIQKFKDMIKATKDEDEADAKKRKECESDYKDYAAEDEAQRAESKAQNLLKERKEELSGRTQAKWDEADANLKQATADFKEAKKNNEDRTKAYNEAKKDDEDMVNAVTDAQKVLKAFFEERVKDDAATATNTGGAPGVSMDMGSTAGAGKTIITMLQHIIDDTNNEIANATKVHEDEEAAYQEYKTGYEKNKAALEEEMRNLMSKKGVQDGEATDAGNAHDSANTARTQNQETWDAAEKANICKILMDSKQYAQREDDRQREADAINRGITLLENMRSA